jgi:hypothetical protein
VLEILHSKTWGTVARTEIVDPYGDSYLNLLRHPDRASVVVWMAAGQDGQCLYSARQDKGAIVAERFPHLTDTSWPSFTPSGEEFLVISSGALRRFKYPDGKLSGRMECSADDADDQIGYLVSYVDAGRALVQSNNRQLYLVDVETMTFEDKVNIQGHDARPVSQIFYQSPKGNPGFWSDCSLFLPLPNNRFLSIHEPSGHPAESHAQLLTFGGSPAPRCRVKANLAGPSTS